MALSIGSELLRIRKSIEKIENKVVPDGESGRDESATLSIGSELLRIGESIENISENMPSGGAADLESAEIDGKPFIIEKLPDGLTKLEIGDPMPSRDGKWLFTYPVPIADTIIALSVSLEQAGILDSRGGKITDLSTNALATRDDMIAFGLTDQFIEYIGDYESPKLVKCESELFDGAIITSFDYGRSFFFLVKPSEYGSDLMTELMTELASSGHITSHPRYEEFASTYGTIHVGIVGDIEKKKIVNPEFISGNVGNGFSFPVISSDDENIRLVFDMPSMFYGMTNISTLGINEDAVTVMGVVVPDSMEDVLSSPIIMIKAMSDGINTTVPLLMSFINLGPLKIAVGANLVCTGNATGAIITTETSYALMKQMNPPETMSLDDDAQAGPKFGGLDIPSLKEMFKHE